MFSVSTFIKKSQYPNFQTSFSTLLAPILPDRSSSGSGNDKKWGGGGGPSGGGSGKPGGPNKRIGRINTASTDSTYPGGCSSCG